VAAARQKQIVLRVIFGHDASPHGSFTAVNSAKHVQRAADRRAAWNWLPVFLAVAESGSVVRASRELGLTPAAVSRTVRLLEQQLGQTLFSRVGRSLQLNAAGSRLRESVRSAVNEVDLGFESLAADPISGPLRVASHGTLTEHVLLPCLLELKAEHPALIPEQLALVPSDARELLARGQVDVAIHDELPGADELHAERVGAITFGVYCGATHPLFSARAAGRAVVEQYAFCVPYQVDRGKLIDGWPNEWPRAIGMRVSLLTAAVRVGLSGALLVALPDTAVVEQVQRGELRRLPIELPSRDVYAASHEASSKRASVAELIRRVRRRMSTVLQPPSEERVLPRAVAGGAGGYAVAPAGPSSSQILTRI
jgi:DNA-binding transcriptional LysR family regulator